MNTASYFWFGDFGLSTCDNPVSKFGSNDADSSLSDDAAIELSHYHFPVREKVPLGTDYTAQNCYFFPDFHDGTSDGSDDFYGPLSTNSDVGEWWCSSGKDYDASSSVQMGNCYKSWTDSGAVSAGTGVEVWTLYYCRAELNAWQ